MSRYQHTKGQIKDNAIEALLHDPLFRQRVEKNKKGKGSYMRKGKHGNRGNWEASGKKVNHFFTSLFRILCKYLFSEVAVQAVTELDNKAAHCH
ncbi:hypothetical protein C4390_44960, partial [Escherichia coli O127:H27 str. C43/90]